MELEESRVSIREENFAPVARNELELFLLLPSTIATAKEMMIYHYYFKQDGMSNELTTTAVACISKALFVV